MEICSRWNDIFGFYFGGKLGFQTILIEGFEYAKNRYLKE
jgi:hypothetical protein